ncbi:MAG: CP12 domain-containing protein [Nodosilinea sp.]
MTSALDPAQTAITNLFSARRSSLKIALQDALEHARRLTALYGTANRDVALAWETVEELETARSRQQEAQITTFMRYCSAYPDASECRLYEA